MGDIFSFEKWSLKDDMLIQIEYITKSLTELFNILVDGGSEWMISVKYNLRIILVKTDL